MSREQLIEGASNELAIGLDAAAKMIADWLKTHDEPRATLCKSVAEAAGIPQAWNALRVRVQRIEAKASDGAESGRTRDTERKQKSHAKRYIETAEPEQIAELVQSLPAEQVKKIAASVSARVARLDTPFQMMSASEHLDAALDVVNEMISDGSPTAEQLETLKSKAEAIVSAVEFAEALAGSDA